MTLLEQKEKYFIETAKKRANAYSNCIWLSAYTFRASSLYSKYSYLDTIGGIDYISFNINRSYGEVIPVRPCIIDNSLQRQICLRDLVEIYFEELIISSLSYDKKMKSKKDL